jgi:hypothetical protein
MSAGRRVVVRQPAPTVTGDHRHNKSTFTLTGIAGPTCHCPHLSLPPPVIARSVATKQSPPTQGIASSLRSSQ